MNYELAKKLFEAGFPQSQMQKDGCFDYDFQNLSELIEACGEDFSHLTRLGEKNWYACALSTEEDDFEKCDTPEEAVADLWLRLNK